MSTQGLPARLPEGERIIWQGSPNWRVLVRSLFHVRMVAAYFALIILWCVAGSWRDGSASGVIALSAARMTGAALVPLGFMTLYAWLMQRTSVYTITNRRVVMHFGVAFPMSFNIPFAKIAGAALTTQPDGSGDIPLQLAEGEKLAYLVMWPNVRPWRMAKPEPMIRGIDNAQSVAQLLSRALAASASLPVRVEAVAPRAAAANIGTSTAAAAA
jgi:hypothetical protein